MSDHYAQTWVTKLLTVVLLAFCIAFVLGVLAMSWNIAITERTLLTGGVY